MIMIESYHCSRGIVLACLSEMRDSHDAGISPPVSEARENNVSILAQCLLQQHQYAMQQDTNWETTTWRCVANQSLFKIQTRNVAIQIAYSFRQLSS